VNKTVKIERKKQTDQHFFLAKDDHGYFSLVLLLGVGTAVFLSEAQKLTRKGFLQTEP
jgi:hypothetical protein